MDLVIQILSVLGAGAILLAFFLLQQGRWQPGGRRYLWSNFLGGLLLTVVAAYDRRLGFIALEATWALVSGISLLRSYRTFSRRSMPS